MITSHPHNQNRSAFTLIELLMVVTIIGFIMTISVVVMSGITVQAEEEATKTTILKVTRLLEQRIEAFDRAFKGNRRDQYVKGTVGLLRAIDGRFDYYDTHPDEAPPAILLLARKAGFRFEFPQRIAELNVGGGATPSGPPELTAAVTDSTYGLPFVLYRKSAYPIATQQLIDEGNSNPTRPDVNTRVSSNWAVHLAHELAAQTSEDVHGTESSELLYFTLTQSGTFGSSPVDADQFTPSEVADTDLDGFPEFIDAWGHPLRFYRWPTRLFDPTAPNPFAPDFDIVNDNTEVDPTPDGDESDKLREILVSEREYAGLLVRGLPPSPFAIGGATQRDLMLVDPDDPVGILYTFIEDPKYKDMGIDLTREFNEAKYHTPDTYHAPLIVSAGPDELLGLREPTETDPSKGIFGNLAQYAGTFTPGFGITLPSDEIVEQLFDNVTNRNRRAGGRR
ncbi:MAG: type II secretion system protein [Fuerstiella sp.]|nr:type II secretion system protein [Fuerstiella sp.]MCP4854230.1 type II secretion system protein [Fuerstiella sp.]